jgi:predicted DNA-binding transcriptional regulator AlpA
MSLDRTPADPSIDPSVKQLVEHVVSATVDELWARMRRGDVLVAPEYLSPKQVSQLTSISVKTLEAMRGVRKGPPYYKIGGRVRYKLQDVRKYIESSGPVK